jgi:peroxiredoxin
MRAIGTRIVGDPHAHGHSERTPVTPQVFDLDPPGRPAPPWTTREWFNTRDAVQLADLRGKVVVLHAFQMLCPACVRHGLPQAQLVHAHFALQDVAVIGLHTVFEHHAAMTPVSLQAFLHEYRIGFPVGVDAPSADARNPIPVTMQAYGMQGTPSLVLIDRNGHLRHHAFGAVDDLALGAAIATLILESGSRPV